ncbi:transcriptional regulator [Paenibacillus sp. L3-i20]|nr:transcriptional regulator [Paenibacillus sp. L3-i20]
MGDLRQEIRAKIENQQYNCEKELTLSIISGKWKVVILYHLGVEGAHRFSDIKRLFPKISHKVLTNQLRELEEDGIVNREVFYETSPIQVEYSLTEVGESLLPIVLMMYEWGKERMESLKTRAATTDTCDNRDERSIAELNSANSAVKQDIY